MFGGDPVLLVFRYIPRAAKHQGEFGVFYRDPDAGSVAIGYYDPDRGEVVRQGTLYPEAWEAWLGAELREHRCAWCGRKFNEETTRFTHDTKTCDHDAKT